MPTPPEKPASPLTDAQRGERLQKVMANAGVASRRACEALIVAGRVRVNDETVTQLPAWVDPSRDRIDVDGEPVLSPRGQKRRQKRAHTYLVVHKPRRVITTTDDEQGRTTVLDLIDEHIDARLYPVGRLDADSTGLVLLTDDGDLAHQLTHPSHGVPKHYRVTIRGRLTEDDRQKLQRGLHLGPEKPAPGSSAPGSSAPGKSAPGKSAPGKSSPRKPTAKRAAMDAVKILRRERDRTHGDRTVLSITLREGRNREIRRMLARLGYKVRRLARYAIGPVHLKDLPSGAWRHLTTDELRRLRHAARAAGRR